MAEKKTTARRKTSASKSSETKKLAQANLDDDKSVENAPDAHSQSLVETAKSEADVAPSPSEDAVGDDHLNAKSSPAKKGGIGFGGGLALLLSGGIAGVFAAPHVAPLVPDQIAQYIEATEGGDNTEFQDAISGVNTAVEGLTGRIDALESKISELPSSEQVDLSSIQAEIEALKAQPAVAGDAGSSADLSAVMAELEALRGANQELQAKVETGIAEAKAEASATLESAVSTAELAKAASALASLKLNVAEGRGFANEITALRTVGVEVPQALADASGGIVSLAVLEEKFGDLAIEAIRASIRASSGEGSGLMGNLTTGLKAQFAGRSTTPQEGFTPDAILSRAEDHMRKDNLDQAIAEISALPSEATQIMAPWVTLAEERLGVMAAIAQIEAALSGTKG